MIKGLVRDEAGRELSLIYVVNQRTGSGNFGLPGGKFELKVLPTDTVLISSRGYMVNKFRAADSLIVNRDIYITLYPTSIQLKEVAVTAIKRTSEIRDDINKLGVRNTDTYKKVNAFVSPITALYERFSKMEKQKREIAILENEDRKRKVLKDLFRNYISYDLIELDDEEFENFIAYLNLSEQFMKESTDYELAETIRKKFKTYRGIEDKVY